MFLDPLLKFGQTRFPALLFVSSIEDGPLDAPVDAIRPFEARPTNTFPFQAQRSGRRYRSRSTTMDRTGTEIQRRTISS